MKKKLLLITSCDRSAMFGHGPLCVCHIRRRQGSNIETMDEVIFHIGRLPNIEELMWPVCYIIGTGR